MQDNFTAMGLPILMIEAQTVSIIHHLAGWVTSGPRLKNHHLLTSQISWAVSLTPTDKGSWMEVAPTNPLPQCEGTHAFLRVLSLEVRTFFLVTSRHGAIK